MIVVAAGGCIDCLNLAQLVQLAKKMITSSFLSLASIKELSVFSVILRFLIMSWNRFATFVNCKM